MVSRSLCMRKAPGSIPGTSTIFYTLKINKSLILNSLIRLPTANDIDGLLSTLKLKSKQFQSILVLRALTISSVGVRM